MNSGHTLKLLLLCLFLSFTGIAQTADFSKASILLTEKKNIQVQKAVQVLQEEIQ